MRFRMRGAILINDVFDFFPAVYRIICIIATMHSKNIFVVVPKFINDAASTYGIIFAKMNVIPLLARKNINWNVLMQIVRFPLRIAQNNNWSACQHNIRIFFRQISFTFPFVYQN